MNKYLNFLIVTFMILGSLSAQNFIHSIAPVMEPKSAEAVSEVKILAVMVEFQKDNLSNTFGDGSFGSIYSKDYGEEIIDPLPHNADYFRAHLDFAVDYYNKVSDGKLKISYELLDTVFKVSQNMIGYSPQINSHELAPLADLSSEVWELADANNSVDFSQYDMFIIFHAGAGRDVSLPGSIGLERDLPSVYLSESALKNIFGDSFKGFPVNNGSFNITNSAILPETESRELSIIGGTTLIELSINGLIVADIASHLGLPDLFDTESGKSAIGRFGLMDGQAIFAYGGLFPPALSAWEKIYLGWMDVPPAKFSGNYSLLSPNGVIKIPINANEYFLVENRERDALQDGARLTVWQNGVTTQRTFPKDQEGFYSFDISALQGVVTSVDEYDWALPGSGIVIWHIDEKVINEKLKSNTINADKNRRGVDVEEADGIQDIGEEFQTIFGDVVIGEGDSVDLWFASNPSELFTNRFDNNSKPNTNSNEGGSSLVTISDFTDPERTMTFSVNFASGIVEKYNSFSIDTTLINSFAVYNHLGNSSIFFLSGTRLFETDISGGKSAPIALEGSSNPSFYETGEDLFIAVTHSDSINILFRNSLSESVYQFAAADNFSTDPVWNFNQSGNKLQLYAGTENGDVKNYDFTTSPSLQLTLSDSVNYFTSRITGLAIADNYYLSSTGNKIKNNFGDEVTLNSTVEKITLTQKSGGNYIGLALTANGNLYLLDEKLNETLIAENCGNFSLGNIKNDGENHVVYYSGNKIYSVSLTGAVDDGFPFQNSFDAVFTGTPLTGKLTNANYDDIVIADTSGNIFILDGSTGKEIPPSPISLGVSLLTDISLFVNNTFSGDVNSLAFIASNARAIIWNISGGKTGAFSWSGINGNPANSNYLPAPESGNVITEFFPQSKVYNWPNPVYGGETNIHYYVSEDSDVEINIFDLSGNLVQTLRSAASGGFENEVRWNVSGIESGVYFAHVNVKSSSGKNDLKIIKIAVIH